MHELQQQIGAGEYRVDNHAVADAILRRLMAGSLRAAAPRVDAPDDA